MNSGMVVVRCWAAGGTAATMGGKGVSAWDTMEGAIVELPEEETPTKGKLLEDDSSLVGSRVATAREGVWRRRSWRWGLTERSNK